MKKPYKYVRADVIAHTPHVPLSPLRSDELRKGTARGVYPVRDERGVFSPLRIIWHMILKRKILIISTLVILFFLPIAYLTTRYQSKTEAAWMDDHWGYRQTVAITNSGTAQTDFQVSVTVDTATLITAGKMQSDCDDIRITDVSGKILAHWIETGTNACNTATTKIWTRIPSLPTSGSQIYLYYGNSSATSNTKSSVLATSCSGVNAYLGSGLYFIDPDGLGSTTPFQAYCDMTTDSGGWTLVASWNTAQEWTKTSTSTSNVFGTTALDAVSSNFGNASVTDYRILASDAVTTTGSSAYADWYYHYNTATTWKEVWAPTSNTGGHVGDGYRSTTPRQSLKPFNYSYNIRFAYQVTQTYNNIADWSYTGQATAGCLPNYWGALTTAGGSFGVFSTNYYSGSNGVGCASAVSDGSLALCPSNSPSCITGQDMNVQNTKIGYDDGGAYARFGATGTTDVGGTAGVDATTKLWWFIRSSAPTSNSFSVGAPSNEQKSLGPVAYWKFDEGYGNNVNDSTPNSNTGSITAATWQTENQCISGKCLYFDGSNDYVTNNRAISFGTGNFTVSFWMKMGGTTGNYTLFDEGGPSDSTKPGYQMFISNTSLRYNISNGSGNWEEVVVSNTSGINDNKWHYVTWTYNAAQNQFYVDGNLKMQRNWTYGSGSPSANFLIGKSWTASPIGFMDDFRIYNYTRSAAQIKSDFASKGSGSVKGTSAALGVSSKNSDALSNGLVGYWKMDENTGTTTVDSSGNTNTATFYHEAAWTTGKFVSGVVFDGYDDVIKVPSSTGDELNPADTVSVTAWIYINGSKSNNYIATKGWGDNYELKLNGSNALQFQIINDPAGNYQTATSTTTVSTGTWVFVVGTYDKQYIRVYINGELAGSIAYSNSIYQGGQSFAIGGIPHMETGYYGNGFNGKIDETRIYNRALSPREVRDLYAFAPGPVGYWNMDEGTGTTLYDKSGNNYSSTAFATPVWTTGKFGKALLFDGDDNVSLPASLTGNSAFTAEAWIYSTVASSWDTILGEGCSGFTITKNTSTLQFGRNCGQGNGFYSGPTLNINTWYHVAMVFDGTNADAYVNGIKYAGGASTFTHGTTYIGSYNGTQELFNGKLDDVKIYNYARSQKQIVEDMNAGHPAGGSPVGSQVLYYKFDEGHDGTAYDSSPTGLNATLSIGATGSQTTVVQARKNGNDGKFNRGLSFDGTDDQLNIGYSSALNLPTDFTFSTWVYNRKASGTVDPKLLLYHEVYLTSGFRVWISTTNYFQFTTNQSGGTVSVTSNTQLAQNQWYHLAVTYSGTTATLYINGKFDKSGTGTYVPSAANYFLAGQGDARYFYDAIVDEVKIYPSALTSDEIALDYNRGASMVLGTMSDTSGLSGGSIASSSATASYCVPGGTDSCSPPVGEWNFEEKISTNAYDTSGNGNTGVLTNGPTWTTGKVGTAVNFNANDKHVDIGAAKFDTLTNATVEMWFYYAGTFDANRLLFYRYKDGSNRQPIFVSYSGGYGNKLVFENIVGGSNRGITSDSTISTNTWYHATFTCGTGGMKMYLNGVQQASTNATTDCFSSIAATVNNKIGWTANTFIGTLDQVKIYDYVRTQAQIAYDYNRGAPVAHWKFDECQGITANDSSGNGNSGTITIGATVPQSSVGTCTVVDTATAWYNGATGKYNSSLNFDGVDDFALIGDSSSLSPTTQLSISSWVYTSQANFGSWTIVGKDNAYQNQLVANNNIENSIYCQGSGWTQNQTSSSPLTPGQWNHVVVTYDGTKQKTYANGRFIQEWNLSCNINDSASSLYIGSWGGGSEFFNGQIDDVRVFNYALTAQQVKLLFNQSSGVRFGPSTGSP